MLLAFVDIFSSGVEHTQNIAANWDLVWQQVFGLGDEAVAGLLLYNALVQVARIFAVGSIVIFAIFLIQQLSEGKFDILQHFLWALVVAALLANNGRLLIGLSITVRDLIRDVNQQVLTYSLAGASLQDNFETLQQSLGTKVIAANYFQHCEYLVGESQRKCLQEVAVGLDFAIREMQANGNHNPSLDWLLILIQRILPADPLTATANANSLSDDFGKIQAGLNSLFLPAWESAVFTLLNGFMQAYQHFLELSLLLTALMGPLAVGGSIIPGGQKVLFAWLTGFFTVGFAKLSFNIVSGLAATAAAANTSMPEQFPFYMIFAVLAPVLSGALSVGGGIAVWQAATGSIEGLIDGGYKLLKIF